MTAVVDQGINSLLQHSLLVAHDNVGCFELEHTLETVVSVNDTTVQIIQIRGGIAAAVEHDHRAQIRRNDRNHVHDHPCRLVAGLEEGLNDLESLEDLDLLLAVGETDELLLQGSGKILQEPVAVTLAVSPWTRPEMEASLLVRGVPS